ncbi:ABC transporter substrate-binding protein [Methanobrevibacter thaueri]|jgi:NitT/TauT family transport system substrate-binding protein|uniref:Taurine-binding periplasmic protein n=1 Tax=Methanobrevibacter thaueri TaxID=190975 RepID=A0A315XP51_9EURY|nr:ABC transporter substrate-binding protein [Methanobrevibacter thaueri]PWB88135.1 taurine-binding periplasmic protein precursor [Methanobrevibacter thaueri]
MNKKITFVLVLALAAFLVMGSASAGLFDFLGGGDDTVKIGYLPSDHDAALFVADAQGLYKEKNISTELVQFNNGGDLMTAMASGDVDVGYVGIAPVLSSVSSGVPVKVISSAQVEGSGIIVTDDSNIKSAQDLAGKTIATPGEASIQHVLLSAYLKANGMSLDDVNESAMKVPSINDALKTGNLPAAITFQPYVSLGETDDNIDELVDSSEIMPGHPCCVVVASDDFIKNHEDTAKDIVAIHENATTFINEQIKANKTDDIVKLLPEDIVADPAAEADSLQSFPFIFGLDDTYKANVDAFQQLEVDLGILNETISHEDLYWEA